MRRVFSLLLISCFLLAAAGERIVKITRISRFFPDSESPTFFTAPEILLYRGRIYVVDNFKHRIMVFSTAGEFLFKMGRRGLGPGDLYLPANICRCEDRLAVNDEYGISFFDLNGNYISKFKTSSYCDAIACAAGRLYCLSPSAKAEALIKIYTEDGRQVGIFLKKEVVGFVDLKNSFGCCYYEREKFLKFTRKIYKNLKAWVPQLRS